MSTEKKDTVAIDRSLAEQLLLFPHHELKRQRRNRALNIAIKMLLVIGFVFSAYFLGSANIGAKEGDKHSPHLAFIEVYGTIMSGQLADADRLIPALHKAFKDPLAKAVALRINSPGGSPVHAGRLYSEINQLRAQYHNKPVYAVIEDIGTSAAYYISSAADFIYVDQASMVGSIGVISASFGFTGLMEKLGIERRVLTSGANKNPLDPYLPMDLGVKHYWEDMLAEVHQQFIQAVKTGRSDRLQLDYPDLFSGLVWTGAKSIDIGLADQLGSLASVSRDTIGVVNTVNYTPSPDFFRQLTSRAHAQLGAFTQQLRMPSLF
ncbi:MAG: S49 family peptidase [Cellvibrionaceae bacterium]|nr:S49 family peptidase [Cellvibrionaceae bacterium]